MTTIRISAAPDSNGVVKVSCGNDVIEIQVVQPAGASAGGQGNPFDTPHVYLRVPTAAKVDLDSLLKKIDTAAAAASRQRNHRTVVLSVDKIDVHDLSHVGQQIAKVDPDLHVGIEFHEKKS